MKLIHLSLIAIAALSLNATAEEPKAAAQPARNIMERHDQSGVPGKEIVIGTATFPPGSIIGYHTHPGDEVGYVLKGNFVLRTQGQADKHLKAGDSFFNPRGASCGRGITERRRPLYPRYCVFAGRQAAVRIGGLRVECRRDHAEEDALGN